MAAKQTTHKITKISKLKFYNLLIGRVWTKNAHSHKKNFKEVFAYAMTLGRYNTHGNNFDYIEP